MNVEKDPQLLRELGIKLANFRNKLALAIGQKKITQEAFGEMFGGQSPRQITSYERGEVDPPASMLYLIWKSGNSIDGIFAEQSIEENGKPGASALFDSLTLAHVNEMDRESVERAIREIQNAKSGQVELSKDTLARTSGKGKASHHPARPTKKR